jgi:hypothetical protein
MAFRFLKRTGGDCIAPIKVIPGKNAEDFTRGEPINLESGLGCAAAAADSAIVGISNQTKVMAEDGDTLEAVLALEDVVFRVGYITGTKTSLTNADIGTAFDLDATDNASINLDDTTGGMWVVVGFDNTLKTADVKLKAANRAAIV